MDQPRRGRAGRSTLPATITPKSDEEDWFGTFRLGIWPDFFPGVQFSREPEALNQYFRQITPDTGPLDPALNRRGGDVTVVHLPEIGIRGNTHFPFSDLNNVQIADELSTFLSARKLD